MSRSSSPKAADRSAPVQSQPPAVTSSNNPATTVEPSFQHKTSQDEISTAALALGALGIVYGDIGTSPLYAIRECFHGMHAIALTEGNVLGVLSLVFWSLTFVVSIKYVGFILRADNRGEGGIFSLLALIKRNSVSPRVYSLIVFAAVFGSALLYGDGVITPAISVLSAIEGLEVATTAAAPFVVPLTCVILFTLFLFQSRGTGDIGKVFGPVMIVWFLTIAAIGVVEIIRNPHVLLAINPKYAISFFADNRFHGAVVLGAVVLCITGGEALYADLGHFGAKAIRISWLGVAFPALLLNYLGQGALLLTQPDQAANPFYGLVPKSLLYPMVALSTVATIIASQAMISGVFSLTQQAIQLGFCPRMHIIHTSHHARGQIYIPNVNYALMIACIGLVLIFEQSSRLAAAYGIAVTATMGFTTLIYYFVITRTWNWPLHKAICLAVVFLLFDVSYFGANLLKVADGGWFTLLIATLIMIAMVTWRDGRAELSRKMSASTIPLKLFLDDVATKKPVRVPGTAVFMTISPVGTPVALLHHFKHNHVLHEKVILLSILSIDEPTVPVDRRVQVEELREGFYRLIGSYGFMEKPNVQDILRMASRFGLDTAIHTTTFYLGRETLLTTGPSKMMRWRKALFTYMSRNAQNPTMYFDIPVHRVVEMGVQIEL